MARIKAEDILKPGAVLEVKEIDPNDPFFKALMKAHEKGMKECARMKRLCYRYPYYWK